MRPGGHGWPHPRYTPFDTHLGRLITETGVFQVKLTGPSRCDHLASCRIGPRNRWRVEGVAHDSVGDVELGTSLLTC